MNPRIRSLFQKEWIKLRRGVWLLPLILGYAAVDSLLVLRTIDRTHGAFGLWATLVSKEPAFFKTYLLLGACGAVLGFLQAWPECQGRRLRLMFHLPVEPQRVLTVLLGTGLTVLLALNLAAHAALAASLAAFHLPLDILGPVLLSLAPWSLLSLAAYLGTVAFFGSRSLPQKALVLVCCYALCTLLAAPAGYGRFAPSLGRYALATLLFVPLVYHAYLRFMGDPLQGRLFRCMRGLSLLAGALALCAILPGLFGRLAVSERVRQSLHFSPVHGRFVQSSTPPDRGNGPVGAAETRYALEDGQRLTRDQYADALPVLYAEDLMKWKRFPET
ncbi:MAG: DUF4857 domain-containing protein, partial [Holophaga sp.]|nr:DUF4857 domain-containing protein [Holophaga sp.]